MGCYVPLTHNLTHRGVTCTSSRAHVFCACTSLTVDARAGYIVALLSYFDFCVAFGLVVVIVVVFVFICICRVLVFALGF